MVYLSTHTHTTVDTDSSESIYYLGSLINKLAAVGWENLSHSACHSRTSKWM